MSYFTYVPNSFSSPLIQERTVGDGIYDKVVQSFIKLGPKALYNAEPNMHFFRSSSESWNKNGYMFRDADSVQYSGNVPQQLTDKSKAKWVIVIACPSQAPRNLKNLFKNQIAMFANMAEADGASDNTKDLLVKHMNCPLKNGEKDEAIALTSVTYMYTVPRKVNTSSQSTPSPKKKYRKRALDEDSESEPESAVEPEVVDPGVDDGPPVLPTEREIFVGADYDRRLMPGYGGRVFAQCFARLVQQNWRRMDNKLILPWEYHEKLRPGTLIVANVSIRVWDMNATEGSKMRRKAVINSLRVIATSDVPIVIPKQPLEDVDPEVEDLMALSATASDSLNDLEFLAGRQSSPARDMSQDTQEDEMMHHSDAEGLPLKWGWKGKKREA
ncbi:hypothetical protein GYMLUDRAFT_250578 [Collybiopsis luxurians FD-317 M1]|uniref:Unplaced genomic scaffold GYMLUscaffold_84, whole genome shotgun sequence n=1 Tax=Collybiopsis luxurians FD-317 M1 TaxID=944289 RepID=A0A0D0BU65_9AGAR|nr:hypothetical protein GYMLUDRAFT_250578 [Collybiopsis luxurians FD-317 M1]